MAPRSTALTMQEALLTLTEYWAAHGCLIAQPMNTEVGAGTLNPATFLRVLGPEPWRVAYVEPSVRPDDARYGENPNRLQTHTQFQVILKPEPSNAQELYLGSLAALGVDTTAHDIRFVEDNWAAPALGAWGLGWEVWLDGLEITQFTYFQQAGGMAVDPVSVELTYGIERICMATQHVSHFADIAYTSDVSYGEAFKQAEYEMSRYYLDDADVEINQRLFESYETEAKRMIDARLPVPAHSYVLKCSHAFNVLDSRGAISPTERARAFARMRTLAHDVAELWVARREELEHPLGAVSAPSPAPLPPAEHLPTEPATFLWEIGVEEMPPHEARKAASTLADALSAALANTRLDHSEVKVYATPRRLAAVISQVSPQEPDSEKTSKGPRVAQAFDESGAPTKAAEGFARSQGVSVAELERLDVSGVEHLALTATVPGRPAVEVLAEIVATVGAGLRSDKNMRWNVPGAAFTRPIRWTVALLGDAVVPCGFAGLTAGRATYVHRTAGEPQIPLSRADDYANTMRQHGIVVDAEARRNSIIEQAQGLASSVGGHIDAAGHEALIDEIVYLVEEPHAVLGGFEPRYLELPSDVLTTVMRKHQRYLPVFDGTGALMPHFVAVANGTQHDDAVVRDGNEAVLRARYEDAAFFFTADRKRRPEDFLPELDRLTFAEKLGSVGDRARRIGELAGILAGKVDLQGEEASTLERAGQLAKFDLATQMVTELTSLAGEMAREYAMHAGEPPAVAQALFEMELPRTASDRLPESAPGALLALADRLDLLTGLFAIGAAPRGSSDPFGMRRAALGVIALLRQAPAVSGLSIRECLTLAGERQSVEMSSEAFSAAEEFIAGRFEHALLEEGVSHTVIAAVRPLFDRPAIVDRTLAELAELSRRESFGELAMALQRVARIVPAGTALSYDVAALREPAEKALAEAYGKVEAELAGAKAAEMQATLDSVQATVATAQSTSLQDFAAAGQELVAPINRFFDEVLVMADDAELRAARLGLLASIAARAGTVLNWQAV